MKKLITLFAAFFFSGIMFAQNTVSGVVIDSEVGTGLPGASIVVKGTSNGVSSDFNGAFTISASSGDVLVVSYIGYETQEVTVAESTSISVQLEPSDNVLSGLLFLALFH